MISCQACTFIFQNKMISNVIQFVALYNSFLNRFLRRFRQQQKDQNTFQKSLWWKRESSIAWFKTKSSKRSLQISWIKWNTSNKQSRGVVYPQKFHSPAFFEFKDENSPFLCIPIKRDVNCKYFNVETETKRVSFRQAQFSILYLYFLLEQFKYVIAIFNIYSSYLVSFFWCWTSNN